MSESELILAAQTSPWYRREAFWLKVHGELMLGIGGAKQKLLSLGLDASR